jgi:hypothetical protein
MHAFSAAFYTFENFPLLIIFGRKQKGTADEELRDAPHCKIFILSVLMNEFMRYI